MRKETAMSKFEDICPICGQEIAKEAVERGGAVVCPDCGTSYHKACWEKAGGCVTFACPSRPNAQPQPQYTYNQTPEPDIPSTGLNVLSLFFPVVGLILYIIYADKTPKKAKAIGKFALIGVAIEVVGGILWGCAAAMMTSMYLF